MLNELNLQYRDSSARESGHGMIVIMTKLWHTTVNGVSVLPWSLWTLSVPQVYHEERNVPYDCGQVSAYASISLSPLNL